MNTHDLIKLLEQVSPKKKDLPIVIEAPNGLLVDPKIKMVFADPYDMFSKKAKVIKLVLVP